MASTTMNANEPRVKERFFILTPTPTDKTESGFQGSTHTIYLDAEGLAMRWSGKGPIPQIGDRVKVTMNRIGEAEVKGYFVSWGGGSDWYVGVMALPLKPPAYYTRQTAEAKKNPNNPRWMGEGIGCFFGTEIKGVV